MRRFVVGLSLLLATAAATGCSSVVGNAPAFEEGSAKLKVAASFYPMYEFARAVGGDRADIVNMVPVGTEPHDWEPTAKHMKTLNEAALFIYNGAGMEHWVEKTLGSVDNKSLVAVETSKGLTLLEGHEEHEDDDHGHGHGHGSEEKDADEAFDPHVWLNPLNVVRQVEAIRDAMVKADAANKATYEANAAKYIEQLQALDKEFEAGLTGCKHKEIFTSHAAFGYLVNRYGLEQHAIAGLSPEAEPKPQQMKEIVDEAREHNVQYIFFETLASDKVANVVAKEIGAKTLVLNPFEGLTADEVKAGKNYLSVMRENLANLKIALECGK